MIRIGMVIPTWGKQCGVADYTRHLIDHTENETIRFKIYPELDEAFLSAVKEDSIDVVHVQFEHSLYDLNQLYQGVLAAHRSGVPVIFTLHSWRSDLIAHNLLIADFSSLVIVHSDEMKQLCIQHGYPEEKLAVRPIGCQVIQLEPKEKTKTLFHIKGYPCVGFFGFPFPHKGIRNLIDALHALKAYFPDLKGYFFSHYPNYLDRDHPYYSFHQELGAQFDNHDHLIWVKDFLPESALVNLLHTMDVNVLPYVEHVQKGISAAVRLLLAARRPVITTDYLYFSDLQDEVYKMPDAQADTIAGSICRVLLDSHLQKRLLANSDQFLLKNSWKQVGGGYRELYRRSVANAKGGGSA